MLQRCETDWRWDARSVNDMKTDKYTIPERILNLTSFKCKIEVLRGAPVGKIVNCFVACENWHGDSYNKPQCEKMDNYDGDETEVLQ